MSITVNGYKFVCFSDEEIMNLILFELGKNQTYGNREILRQLGAELRNLSDIKYITHKDFKPFVERRVFRLN
ncbi:TPA: hypothetical protein I7721_19775 [Vibrio vulnificus]|nr:hypothetical protein [Vibrio vulnificus]